MKLTPEELIRVIDNPNGLEAQYIKEIKWARKCAIIWIVCSFLNLISFIYNILT